MGYGTYGDPGFGITPEEVIREFGNPWEGGGHGRSGQNDDETQTMIKVVAGHQFSYPELSKCRGHSTSARLK